jgi:hypothetical protein
MEEHPLALEAKFSKLFRDTIVLLTNSYSTAIVIDEPLENESGNLSTLAGLATFASSALDNVSLQKDIAPLLEAAQQETISATLPRSNYFDQEHFISLTLFDVAINAATMTMSKTLLDMALHRLPMPNAIFSSNTSTTTASAFRIKNLNEMIRNYSQLTTIPITSFQDLLIDVTIPLDTAKATKLLQYYKRLEEQCRLYYENDHGTMTIEQQVRRTGELFENDPQARINLISVIK